MKGLMDIVILRIDKSLPNMATLVIIHMRRSISMSELFALGVVKSMRLGSWSVDMVAMGGFEWPNDERFP